MNTSWFASRLHLSHEKRAPGPWLFRVFVGDEILPSSLGILNKPLFWIPISQNGFHEKPPVFFVILPVKQGTWVGAALPAAGLLAKNRSKSASVEM